MYVRAFQMRLSYECTVYWCIPYLRHTDPMRSLIRIALLTLLLAGAEGVHAQVVDPAPGDAPAMTPGSLPPIQEGFVPRQFEPTTIDKQAPTVIPGPRVRFRLRPVRFSMDEFWEKVSLSDLIDALSRP